ncbi:MAG: hypothetical protein ACE5EQ_01780 [Phycisphaerae bacterium]
MSLLTWVISLYAASPCPADESSVATGDHYRIVCDFKNDRLARTALKTAEASRLFAVALYGEQEKSDDRQTSTIHLYRNTDDYVKADKDITGGRFRKNLAFSSHKTQSSYIVLQPPCTDETLSSVGLPILTRYTIAHEATHLACYGAIPNHRSHPDWLSEGAAMWIAERALRVGKWTPSAERDPYESTRMQRAKDLLTKDRCPAIRQIIRDECNDLDINHRYAVYWLFFRFMKTGKYEKAFSKVLAEARRLGGGEKYAAKLAKFFEKSFGQEDLDRLNNEFREYVKSTQPRWRETSRALETRGNTWTQIAFATNNAYAWRTKRIGRSTFHVTGSVEILPNDRRQMNLLLGKDGGGFISVAFVAGFGVNVFRYDSRKDHWTELAKAKAPSIGVGTKIPFEVRVDAADLRVLVRKKTILKAHVGNQDMTGPWGLGAQAGSAGRWRKVRVTKD